MWRCDEVMKRSSDGVMTRWQRTLRHFRPIQLIPDEFCIEFIVSCRCNYINGINLIINGNNNTGQLIELVVFTHWYLNEAKTSNRFMEYLSSTVLNTFSFSYYSPYSYSVFSLFSMTWLKWQKIEAKNSSSDTFRWCTMAHYSNQDRGANWMFGQTNPIDSSNNHQKKYIAGGRDTNQKKTPFLDKAQCS